MKEGYRSNAEELVYKSRGYVEVIGEIIDVDNRENNSPRRIRVT